MEHSQNKFENWSNPDIFVNRLASKVFKQPNLADCVHKIANSNKIKGNLVLLGKMFESKKKQASMSLMVSEDEHMERCYHICLRSKNQQVVRHNQCKVEKIKKFSLHLFPRSRKQTQNNYLERLRLCTCDVSYWHVLNYVTSELNWVTVVYSVVKKRRKTRCECAHWSGIDRNSRINGRWLLDVCFYVCLSKLHNDQ